MKQKQLFLALVGLVALVTVVYMFAGGDSEKVYQERVSQERERQFKYLKFNAESPLSEEQKAKFDSLNCFPIDEKFKVRARLVPLQNKQTLEIAMSDGTQELYIKHSIAEFELEGRTLRLLLLQSKNEADGKNFFLTFADATSGESTYGGGRYLNLRQDGMNSITIDFNLAYNPYCAYNPDFACPIPPKENILDIPIKAGEKNYKE